MGLLDIAKEETNKYVSPKDFLCFLAYKLDEPIENVVSFLIYNEFSGFIDEYYIDKHYRIYSGIEEDCTFKTYCLFDEITKDGFFEYMMFCNDFFDDYPNIGSDLDFYTPIRIDFYYSIDELKEILFIKAKNLDLEDASSLDYTVYSDDTVKAEKSKDERLFKLVDLRSHVTVEDIKPSIKEYGYHSPVGIFEAIIADKMPAPTVTQTEPTNNDQLTKELAAAKTQIADLENQLAQAKAKQADAPADDTQLSGLDKYNADKAYIKTTAKAIASYIWSMDTTQAIRTGDMVQQIRHVMHNVEPELLPNDKAIREWLSDIAPSYAKKGGKTPKNAPNEISLIMKK